MAGSVKSGSESDDDIHAASERDRNVLLEEEETEKLLTSPTQGVSRSHRGTEKEHRKHRRRRQGRTKGRGRLGGKDEEG